MSLSKNLLLTCCALSALAMGGGAAAQTADSPSSTVPAEAATPLEGDELVVTARRVEENVQKVPLSITTLGGDTLKRQTALELKDVALTVPNLQFGGGNSDPSSNYVAIRGQVAADVTLNADQSVGIYVDGLNLPRAAGLRGNFIDVQRVEVLRGPQGTLYGRNTTGGAISVITKNPTSEFGASVQGDYGNYDYWSLTGIVNAPLSDNVAIRIAGQHSQRGPFARNFVGAPLDDQNNDYIRGKLKVDLGRLTAVLSGSYQSVRNSGINTQLIALTPTGGNAVVQTALELTGKTTVASLTAADRAAALARLQSLIGGDPWRSDGSAPSYGRFTGKSAGLDLNWELSDSLAVRSISGWRYGYRNVQTDNDATPFSILTALNIAKSDFYSQELQLLGGGDVFNWVTGAFYSHEKGNEFSASPTTQLISGGSLTIFDGDVITSSKAVFAQANWKPFDRLTLTGGTRYTTETHKLTSFNRSTRAGVTTCSIPVVLRTDPTVCSGKFNSKFDDITWLASASYEIAPDVNTYAKASYGFRGGGQNLRGTGTVESFSSFAPETVTEYELGFKSQFFDRRLRLNVSAYYDDYQDIQRSVVISTPTGATATILTNAAKARIQGFEAEAYLRATEQFTINGTVGYTDAKYKRFVDVTGDRSNEPFPVPKWTYSVSGRYVVPTSLGELGFNLDYKWQSARDVNPQGKLVAQLTQKSFALLNGRVSLTVDAWGADIAFFMRNITDKTYFVSGTAVETVGYDTVQFGEPRTFGIQITKRFGAI